MLENHYGVPSDIANAATQALTSITLRAGRLLANGKLTLPSAERLTIAMITAGREATIKDWRTDHPR